MKKLMIFEKVENVKRPLKKGEFFLVPCIVKRVPFIDLYASKSKKYPVREYITPVINHPHNDKENGQKETHYHADFRFVKHTGKEFPSVKNEHSRHYYCESFRPEKEYHGDLECIILPVINEDFSFITPVNMIAKSKLKHNCIHKGKCPHRGMDLSQVKAVDGVITCPLHGLRFNENSGVII